MKRTPRQLYDYEKARISGYEDRFEQILIGLAISDELREEMMRLFVWNGNARAIMSKAYQEMKDRDGLTREQVLMDGFMRATQGMDIDPLVLDRFFHEGFYESMGSVENNIDKLGLFLREYYGVSES